MISLRDLIWKDSMSGKYVYLSNPYDGHLKVEFVDFYDKSFEEDKEKVNDELRNVSKNDFLKIIGE